MKAALYLRLSRDDGEQAESGSIRNQYMQLSDYAAKNGFEICAVYSDDGFSGTKWNRPSFQEMLYSAERGQFQIVLVKDLSRLSRDYVKTGMLLEEWFPQHGVRLIAVDDGIDTAKRVLANDFTPIYALMNDWYARDISRKVRAAIHTRQQNGICTLAILPYGYCRTDDGIRMIPQEAEIIRMIFTAYQAGKSCRGIAENLTNQKVLPPNHKYFSKHTRWNDVTIGRILDNTVYYGKMMFHTTEKIGYKTGNRRRLPRTEWLSIPVPQIVSYDLFSSVQQLRTLRSHKPRTIHWLSGCVFCSECGNVMYISEGKRVICSGRKHGNGCHNPSVSLAAIEKMYQSVLISDEIAATEEIMPLLIQTIRIGPQTIELFLRYQNPQSSMKTE